MEGTKCDGGEVYLSLTFTYDLTATDVTLLPEVSKTLETGDSGPGFTIEVSRTDNGDGTGDGGGARQRCQSARRGRAS